MNAREMQIEFERRVVLINPDLGLKDKLTSDTIFSFLNAYTERYIYINYLQEDAVVSDTRAQKRNVETLKELATRTLLPIVPKSTAGTDRASDRAILPDDYLLYIRSNSLLSQTYKTQLGSGDDSDLMVTPNKTIKEDDIHKILSTYYNKSIMLNPYIVLNTGTKLDTDGVVYINVVHDTYTVVDKLDLLYYRKPKKFNVIGVDGVNIIDYCELADSVHMELVEGAVEMFITEAKYRTAPSTKSKQ